VLEEHIASIFSVEKAKQDTSMKAEGKLINGLAGNLVISRKQEENGGLDLSSNCLACGTE
jgi:hypothetical protein